MVSTILLMSCVNQNEDGARRFCDNEKLLLFPHESEDWDSTFYMDWDLSLSMDELYKSAIAQVGEDTCIGERGYLSRIDLSKNNSVFIRTQIAKGQGYCPCCIIQPPRHPSSPRIRLAIISDSLCVVGRDTINSRDLEKVLTDWAKQSDLSIKDRNVNFLLQWSDKVAESTFKYHVLTIIEVYLDFMKAKIDWLEDDLCKQKLAINYEDKRYPLLLINVQEHLRPTIGDSLINHNTK